MAGFAPETAYVDCMSRGLRTMARAKSFVCRATKLPTVQASSWARMACFVMPAASNASKPTSMSWRCCGSMTLASATATPKKSPSKSIQCFV